MTKKIKYFVSYAFAGSRGWVDIERDKAIQSSDDILAIQSEIAFRIDTDEKIDEKIVITNWQRFEVEP